MSHVDHEWSKEQLAAHLAGGLPAEERARLEAHVSACAECIAELDGLRRFERKMDELFVPVRPQPGLEERVIRAVRRQPERAVLTPFRRLAASIAAVFMLGAVGFAVMQAESGGFEVESAEIPVETALGMIQTKRASNARAPVVTAAPSGRHVSLDALAAAPERQLRRMDDQVALHGKLAEESDHSENRKGKESEQLKRMESGAVAAKPASPSFMFGNPSKADKDVTVFRFKQDGPADGKAPAAGAYFKPNESLNKLAKVELGDPAAGEEKAAGKRQLVSRSGGMMAQNAQQAGGSGGVGQAEEPPAVQRKIIRSGDVEFEIESFDGAVARVTQIAAEEQGYVGTVNSEKLPNGKVKGTIVVRVPPDRLDTLLLKLRALGELKSQRIGSQDVTKQYYDLESRLRAARTMEERLLKIIKEGKGEIKDLLLAEKELGEWRTRIEGFEGELRYYSALISLSTLNITLYEKEIKAPTGIVETERVTAGLEVEDVEKAHKDVLAAVADAKGRVTKSELKQLAAGQFNAVVHFEVAPDAAGPLRDRLKQLGTMARLEVDRLQEVEGGVGKAAGVNVRRKDSVFLLSIYNLTNVQPREVVQLGLACTDIEASHKTILARIEKAGGRVLSSTLNRQKNEQSSGLLQFEIKSAEADAVLTDLKLAGEVVRFDMLENSDSQNVTRSKRGYHVQLFAMGLVTARETTTLRLAARDVAAAHKALEEVARKTQARILQSFLNEQDRQNISATLDFEVRREHEAAIAEAFRAAGEVLNRSSRRAEDQDRVVDSKVHYSLSLSSLAALPVRETYTMGVEVRGVDEAVQSLEALVAEAGGRVIDARHTRGAGGQHTSTMSLSIPLAKAKAASEKAKGLGLVRVFDVSKNPAAPEGELALARLEVTLSNQQQLVTPGSGPWARIQQGLSFSLTALSWSLSLVVIGLCFILPLGLVGWAGLRIAKRVRKA